MRIVKPQPWQAEKPVYREPLWTPDSRPAEIRPDTGHYGDEYQQHQP